MDMDREGLLNPQGLWNKRGALLGGLIIIAVIVGFNYFYFEQMLGALGLFTAFWLVLLAAVFVLVLAERAAEWAFRRLARVAAPSLRAAWQFHVGPHFSAFRQQLAVSVSRWRWGKVAWAGIPSVSRIDEWRRARARAIRTRSPRHRDRRVA
jgi:hypothetical protein